MKKNSTDIQNAIRENIFARLMQLLASEKVKKIFKAMEKDSEKNPQNKVDMDNLKNATDNLKNKIQAYIANHPDDTKYNQFLDNDIIK